jgi:hypothetical protein
VIVLPVGVICNLSYDDCIADCLNLLQIRFWRSQGLPVLVCPLGAAQLPKHTLLRLALADQDHIGIGVTTDKTQFAVVEGPVEITDVFGIEVGNLLPGRTIQGLGP